ncbi:MAG: hypothetical protein LQ343_005760 [Gyalolechia ehrenbergii]|nr:MAG: hypothetical protein LQ343_005760 [Gyalolechia ehrenbergii]
MSKIIVYTGAPLQDSLSWDEDHLTAPLQPCFLTNREKEARTQTQTQAPTNQGPSWRSIPLSRNHLSTGLTQSTHADFAPYDPTQNEGTSFLSISDLSHLSSSQENHPTLPPSSSEQEQDTDILSQYYEHSFIAHHDLPSSQVLPPPTITTAISSFSSHPLSQSSTCLLDSSTYLRSDISIDNNTDHQKALTRFTATKITNLSSIPTASYLHSITPQTMTVNLLIGIIALPPPRTITTKKDARTVQLVEMIVGDETRAGFGVNVWLPASSHSRQLRSLHNGYAGGPRTRLGDARLQEEMADLRPRDIVLMRNVALTSFRGKVYGQSLRRGMTGVELVWRSVVDEGDRRGWFDYGRGWDRMSRVDRGRDSGLDDGGEGLEKLKKVKEWVVEFVGGGGNRGD